jgi:predicted DNA-binding antitoxin AbrB/MazE fold protein
MRGSPGVIFFTRGRRRNMAVFTTRASAAIMAPSKIGGAMAIHLEAVYEQGVLRPLEPLALAEHQRVHVTVEDRNPPLSSEPAQPLDHSRAELEWLANESRNFAGEWVALDGNSLVAHGPKLAVVKAAAQAAGVSRPFFASVPDDDLPFGGW